MDYVVTGSDGREYGPVSVEDLKAWVADQRVGPATQVRNFHTGQQMLASAIPGLFGPAMPPVDFTKPPLPPGPGTYPQPNYRTVQDDGKGTLVSVAVRSGLALLLFFVLHGIGLIVATFSLIYAVQSMTKGHKYGAVSLGIAAVTFVVILVGWIIRFKSGGNF